MHQAVSLSLGICHAVSQDFYAPFPSKYYQIKDVHHSAMYLMVRDHRKPHLCLLYHFLGCPSVSMCPALSNLALRLSSCPWKPQLLESGAYRRISFLFPEQPSVMHKERCWKAKCRRLCPPIPLGMQTVLPWCCSLSRCVQAGFASPTASPLSCKKILLSAAYHWEDLPQSP